MQSLRPSFAGLMRSCSNALSEVRVGLTPLLRPAAVRTFSVSAAQQSWLAPKSGDKGSRHKGRPRVPTGGSTRGTTVVWGDYGMRMIDHHRRMSALQLKNAEDTIKRRLRGLKYKLYTRVAANIPVYTKGNETRMGTGKGSMDFWASRIPVSRIIFEVKGELHEQVVRDAFRVAGAKMPGKFEFVKKGDVPMMGTMKLTPENMEVLTTKKFLGGNPFKNKPKGFFGADYKPEPKALETPAADSA